jgi:formylglycine-generating enzyme required for sulfatase activity
LKVDYDFELCCRPDESTWECALRVQDASGDLVLELLRRGNAETEEAAIREALAGLAAHLLGEAATVQRPISEATTVPDEGVARVVFDCSPSDTELLIDDGSLGPCAALEGAVELSLGEHRLLMRHPGYAAQQQTLRINSPTERRFSVQLARHGLDSTWISVRSGQFQAGSPRTEDGRSDDEVLTTTNIEQPFEIAATELSQREWRLLMGTDISHFSTCGDDCPVDSINWFDALALANAYSELEGFQHCYDLSTCHGTAGIDFACAEAPKAVPGCEGYRLPTGVEWEYAARAGTQSAFYNGRIADGDDDECETDRGLAAIGWYCKNASIEGEGGFDLSKDEGSSRAGTQPRAQLSPNAWGLFDTAGNVAEWTEEGELRGGSFLSYARHCRSAARQTVTAEQRAASQGVRLVRALEHL